MKWLACISFDALGGNLHATTPNERGIVRAIDVDRVEGDRPVVFDLFRAGHSTPVLHVLVGRDGYHWPDRGDPIADSFYGKPVRPRLASDHDAIYVPPGGILCWRIDTRAAHLVAFTTQHLSVFAPRAAYLDAADAEEAPTDPHRRLVR